MEWTAAYSDSEREMLDAMANMRGKDGLDGAIGLAEKFYADENVRLLERARGNFQREMLDSFAASRREDGLNAAFHHRAVALKQYNEQVMAGEFSNTMTNIDKDPDNADRYLDQLIATNDFLNPGDAPEYRAAKIAEWSARKSKQQIAGYTDQGRFDEARAVVSGLMAPGRKEYLTFIDEAEDRAVVDGLTAKVAGAFQAGSDVTIAESIHQGFATIAKVKDPERQRKMAGDYERNIAFEERVRNAADMEARLKFVAMAEAEGWSPTETRRKLEEAEGFSQVGKTALLEEMSKGLFNKPNLENLAGYDRIRIAIDEANKAGQPTSEEEVKAMAQQYGLTTELTKKSLEYRREGGGRGRRILPPRSRSVGEPSPG